MNDIRIESKIGSLVQTAEFSHHPSGICLLKARLKEPWLGYELFSGKNSQGEPYTGYILERGDGETDTLRVYNLPDNLIAIEKVINLDMLITFIPKDMINASTLITNQMTISKETNDDGL